jgi:hypothetical protein
MHNLVHILLRWLAGIAGALLLYAAFFLYEDEEARLQNRLEQIWARINALQALSLSWERAFLQIVSRTCTQLLDSLFGRTLVSLQATAIALTGACISFAFFTAYLGTFAAQLARHRTLNVILASAVLLLVLLTSWLSARRELAAGQRDSTPYHQKTWLFILISAIGILANNTTGRALALELATAIVITLAFVVLFRWILRKCTQSNTVWLLGAWLVISVTTSIVVILPASIFVYEVATSQSINSEGKVPYLWHTVMHVFKTFDSAHPRGATTLIMVSAMNILNVCGSGLVVCLMLLLVVHRLFWPLIKRPIYAANRRAFVKNTKLLAALGTMLFLYAFPNNPVVKWLTDFLSKLKGG